MKTMKKLYVHFGLAAGIMLGLGGCASNSSSTQATIAKQYAMWNLTGHAVKAMKSSYWYATSNTNERQNLVNSALSGEGNEYADYPTAYFLNQYQHGIKDISYWKSREKDGQYIEFFHVTSGHNEKFSVVVAVEKYHGKWYPRDMMTNLGKQMQSQMATDMPMQG